MVLRSAIGVVADSQLVSSGGGNTISGDATLSVGLEQYHTFNNDDLSSGNPLDSTSNNNDSTNNGCTTGVTAPGGECFDFSTNDFVDSNSVVTLTDDMSFNYWVKSTQTSEPRMGTIDSGENEILYFLRGNAGGNNGSLYFLIIDDGTAIQRAVTSNTGWNDGDWHMITYVKSGNTHSDLLIYVDAVAQTMTNVVTGTISAGGTLVNDMYIGAANANGTAANIYDGLLNAFGRWSKALTQSEITKLYNSGTEPLPYD